MFLEEDKGKTFCWYCDTFLACMIEKENYKKKVVQDKGDVIGICTSSDFAFARIKFEDYYDEHWPKEARKVPEEIQAGASATAISDITNDQREPEETEDSETTNGGNEDTAPKTQRKRKANVGDLSKRKKSKVERYTKHELNYREMFKKNDGALAKKYNKIYKDHLLKKEAMMKDDERSKVSQETEETNILADLEQKIVQSRDWSILEDMFKDVNPVSV